MEPILVGDVMREDRTGAFWVHPDDPLTEAGAKMKKHDVGSLLVSTTPGKVIEGIVTERDFVRKIFGKNLTGADMKVKDIWTSAADIGPLHHTTEDETLNQCMEDMKQNNVRHLPVMDGDDVVGIISVTDVVHSLVERNILLDQNVEDLTAYIQS